MSELICNVHDESMSKIEKIEEYAQAAIKTLEGVKWSTDDEDLKSEIEDAIDNIGDIIYDSSTCIDDIKTAKEMGQKMEDRLRDYHDTLESLGFERKR